MKYSLLVACLVSINFCFAQTYAIYPGEEKVYKKKEGALYKDYMEIDGKYLYVNRKGTTGLGLTDIVHKLEIADISNATSKKALFKLEESNRDLVSEVELARTIFNDKVYAISTINNLDEGKKYIYVRTADFDSTLKKDNKVLLLSIDCEKSAFPMYHFSASFSPDRSKMLITSIFTGYIKDSTKIGTTALIFDLNTLTKISEIPLSNLQNTPAIDFRDLIICNNGDLIGYTFLQNDPSTTVSKDILPSLIKFKANERLPKIINFPAPCSKLPRFKVKMIDETIYVYGTCVGKAKNATELFYAKFDLNTESFTTFNTMVIPAVISRKLDWMKGRYYEADQLQVHGNEVLLFCYNSYDMRITTQDGNFVRSYIEHYKKELLVAKFNTTSDAKNIHLIPKFSHMRLENYHTFYKDGNVYVVYAEHPKNLKESTLENYNAKGYKMIINYNGAVIVCTKVPAKGNITRSVLFRNKGWCFKPEKFDLVLEKENALIIHMIKGKKERFDKLVLQ